MSLIFIIKRKLIEIARPTVQSVTIRFPFSFKKANSKEISC